MGSQLLLCYHFGVHMRLGELHLVNLAFVLVSDEQFLYNLKECEEIHAELLCLIMIMGFSYLSGGNT